MGTVQKVALGIVGIGFLTAATLPDRKTADIIGKIFGGVRDWTYTAISGKK
jgi:hypothetical protein